MKAYDYRDMAIKIESLLNNQIYAKNLGKRLRKKALISMNPKNIEKNQINFYNQLLLKI